MIKQLFSFGKWGDRKIYGLSDNGELYELLGGSWSHVTSSPDDRSAPYWDEEEKLWRNKRS